MSVNDVWIFAAAGTHLEHAGSMQDGTPLLAVFVCEPTKLGFMSPALMSAATGPASFGT